MKIFNTILLSIVISTSIPANDTIFATTLNNGLNVLIKEDPRSPLVMTQVWYAVGSIDEPSEISGISHLLEHLMFKGTVKVPNDEIKRINSEYGGSLNAYTGHSYTYYYQLYPKAYQNLALELEADRMSNLLLRQSDFTNERQIVKEERLQRIDDRPQSYAFEQLRLTAYPLTPYKQPILGFPTSLDNITLSKLQQWYNVWYAPNNATLVVIGDLDTQSTLLQIQRFFGDIPSKSLQSRNNIREVFNHGYRHIDSTKDIHVENLYMAWNVPSLNTAKNTTDAYALTILKELLSGNLSSRLEAELIRKKNILASVNVSYDMIHRGDTIFTITAIPHPSKTLAEAQLAIETEINHLKTVPIEFQELTRLRTNALAKHIYAQDSLQGQAYLLGNTSVNGIPHQLLSELPQHYKNINALDIQQVVNTYFNKNNLTTLYLDSNQKNKTDQTTTISEQNTPKYPSQEKDN